MRPQKAFATVPVISAQYKSAVVIFTKHSTDIYSISAPPQPFLCPAFTCRLRGWLPRARLTHPLLPPQLLELSLESMPNPQKCKACHLHGTPLGKVSSGGNSVQMEVWMEPSSSLSWQP